MLLLIIGPQHHQLNHIAIAVKRGNQSLFPDC